MAIKKSDLYSSLWASCDELRGGMDASQYKDYVLFMLFIKYITDKYGNSTDFAPPVTIPKGASFKDMIALKGKSDIGDKINTQVIAPLVQANDRLARSDFPDFNDSNKLGEGQAKVERLTNLVNIFASPQLDFSQNRADHDDILGDAYEYLMRHFATESGKSKGQFYTPAEVSRIMAKVIGISAARSQSQTIYDPTCGSGSLLLKAADEAPHGISIYGQEMDNATAALARMNMILHGVHFTRFDIKLEDTLEHPQHDKLDAEAVVANPPFSAQWSANQLLMSDDRFSEYGKLAPSSNADFAFIQHMIFHLAENGVMAVVMPHGVLFRGAAEGHIRKYMIEEKNYLDAVIGLPANIFFGTSIPTCILVFKKCKEHPDDILFIDASQHFEKAKNQNVLKPEDIEKIVSKMARIPTRSVSTSDRTQLNTLRESLIKGEVV